MQIHVMYCALSNRVFEFVKKKEKKTFLISTEGWLNELGMDYLTTHTSLSPIRRGFTPGFVNYKQEHRP